MDANTIDRTLRLAMIGGGPGGLIGESHRRAARLDGHYTLVAGAFSSDPTKSRRQGAELLLDPARVYGDWREMLKAEAGLPEARRAEVVAIVTPNHLHYEQATAALEAGFDVILDKPMTMTAAEAKTLHRLVKTSGRVLALTHTYVGYPMVKLARDLIRDGKIGAIRKIYVEYLTGWLYQNIDDANKQASWRTDNTLAGTGCLGDIGTHAAILSETISGRRIVEVAADVSTFVPGRGNDDDFSLLARWENGAKGTISACEVAAGEGNEIMVRVYGDKGGLEWRHSDCERLVVRLPDKPEEVWSRGWNYVGAASPAAARATRMGAIWPEGMIEAFANIYAEAARSIRKRKTGAGDEGDFPNSHEGVRGMLFVEAALASSRNGGKWTALGGE